MVSYGSARSLLGRYVFSVLSQSFDTCRTRLSRLKSLQITANTLYNLYFHPLRHVPGPFWARASAIPSWYHTSTGKRHIWLWQLFQIYGTRIRVAPNLVLFRDPEAHHAIYGAKSNVHRSAFYIGLTKNIREKTTLNTLDPVEYAHRRKILNTCFTEHSVAAVSRFVSQHLDRWHQIMFNEHDSETEWSSSVNLGEKLDQLVFDIIGDISLGRSFNVKEPGENPLREVPPTIVKYLQFYYPVSVYFGTLPRKNLFLLTLDKDVPLPLSQLDHLAQAPRPRPTNGAHHPKTCTTLQPFHLQ